MNAAFNQLAGSIAAYFNIVLNDTDKKRLQMYLNDYLKSHTPAPVVKLVTVEKYVYVPEVAQNKPARNKLLPASAFKEHQEYLETMAKEVCDRHNIPISKLWQKNRKTEIVDARHELILIAVAAGVRHTHIAKFLGYKDHSTIPHFLYHRKKRPSNIAI